MQTDTVPDTAPMEARGNELVTQALAVRIASNDDAQAAAELLRGVAALRKMIEKEFAAPKTAAHEAHKSIVALEKRTLEGPQKAEGILKGVIGSWQIAEAARVRAEERRLQAEAQKRAEENRRHEMAEQARIAAEAQKRAEEARIAEAIELEASGQSEAAEAALAAPIPQAVEPVYFAPVVAPLVRVAPAPIKGISTAMKWSFRIVDVTKIKREYMTPNEVAIRQQVQALGKDAEVLVGGIVFEEVPVTSVR